MRGGGLDDAANCKDFFSGYPHAGFAVCRVTFHLHCFVVQETMSARLKQPNLSCLGGSTANTKEFSPATPMDVARH